MRPRLVCVPDATQRFSENKHTPTPRRRALQTDHHAPNRAGRRRKHKKQSSNPDKNETKTTAVPHGGKPPDNVTNEGLDGHPRCPVKTMASTIGRAPPYHPSRARAYVDDASASDANMHRVGAAGLSLAAPRWPTRRYHGHKQIALLLCRPSPPRDVRGASGRGSL